MGISALKVQVVVFYDDCFDAKRGDEYDRQNVIGMKTYVS